MHGLASMTALLDSYTTFLVNPNGQRRSSSSTISPLPQTYFQTNQSTLVRKTIAAAGTLSVQSKFLKVPSHA